MSIRLYREYETELADAVLPGDDIFRRQLRAALSEMLAGMLIEGIEMSLYNIGDRLSQFTPRWVLEATEGWGERLLKRWMDELRLQIFRALGDYFIEGGHEIRVEAQQTLLDALESAWVRVEGRELLDGVLPWSGDWRARFMGYAVMGRSCGVRFWFDPAPESIEQVKRALNAAGFARGQIQTFLGATCL